MNLSDFWTAATAFKSGASLVVLLSLVQLSPIKLNPWSWVATKIGNAMNKELNEKINQIDVKVDKLSRRVTDFDDRHMEHHIENCRTRILTFGDDELHGINHSQERYKQIFKDIDNYESYCAEHPNFENGYTVASVQTIKDRYQDHVNNNDFLK